MYVDLRSTIGRGLFVSGTFDIEAIRPAMEALREGGTFIDVGANVGFYSVLALDRISASGKVYSFEIDPRPLRCLRKTIADFGYSNIHVVESAVSDIDGTLSYEPNAEHGHNHIDRSATSGRKVPSVKLDTWAAQTALTGVDAIKIDIEGAEKFVIEGARETIRRFKPLLLCECDEKTAAVFGYTPRDLIEQLEGLEYTTSWLDGVFTPTILAKPRRTCLN
jgi:FkbM family methyltransferase